MESILKADIFFFISSLGTIFFILLGLVVAYYLIKILKNVKESTDSLRDEMKNAGERISEIEKEVTESMIFKFIFAKDKKRRK